MPVPSPLVSPSTPAMLGLLLAVGCTTGMEAPGVPTSLTPTGSPDPRHDVVLELTHDPGGYAPLSAELSVEASTPVTVTIRVPGDHGPASDVTHAVDAARPSHLVPVLGLYPAREQDVEVVVRSDTGDVLLQAMLPVETPPLAGPVHDDIEIVVADREAMSPGMTLVSAFGQGDGGAVPTRPLMFDAYGDVRWVLDYADHPDLADLHYDVGVERLANGNLYFGNIRSSTIYEVDMLGRVIDAWPLAPYRYHHNVFEMPDGNFLVTATLPDAVTIEDQILEIDRVTKKIVNVWDLRESLRPTRDVWAGGRDWIHVNSVRYDPTDDTIVISGRHQGVVKLTQDNEVVWILAPHVDWGTAGNGQPLATKLLQPIDAAGVAISSAAVLEGNEPHPDFQWNWYQHAAKVLGNGEIALFDNGANRQFGAEIYYSRAVRYRIDPVAMTVQQTWTYGQSRGSDMYSPIVSDVDVLPDGHVIWSPGAVGWWAGPKGAVVELDPSDQVVFEAYIWSKEPTYGITFHRTERLSLYP